MSYHVYSVYGYGVQVDDIKNVTMDGIRRVLDLAPSFKNDVVRWLKEAGFTIEPSPVADKDNAGEMLKPITVGELYEILEYGDCGEWGLAYILLEALNEQTEEMIFCYANDFDGNQYILFEPNFPWYASEFVKSLTESKIEQYIQNCVKLLTDEKIAVNYYTVENGG